MPRFVPRPAGRAVAVRAQLAGLDGQLLEQLALAWREARGHLDIDEDVQVAARARSPQVRDTLAATADLGAGLGARLDLQQLLAVRREDGDLGAEGRLRDGEAQLLVQLGAVTLQEGVLPRRA